MTDEFDRAARRGGLGLREAFDRYNRALAAQLIDHVATAVLEAVMWTVAIDELHEKSFGDIDGYRARRDADNDGRVVLGLKFVRNQGLHELAVHQEWTDEPGVKSTLKFPATTEFFIRWSPIPHELQPNKPDALYEGYISYLQGAPVRESIQAAARWLDVTFF